MALEIKFVDVDVKRTMKGQFRVSAIMQLFDDLTVLFAYPFGCDYKPGDSVADRVEALREDLQEALDNYAEEQTLKNSNALSNKLDSLKTELTIPQL